MSKPLLIYVISEIQFKHYTSWIKQPFKCTPNFDEADIILFAGGEDVSPSIYGESRHKLTYTNSLRDDTEAFLFNKAQEMGKMCLGICRGSQLLCALSGGKLIQHMYHPEFHTVEMKTGEQMQAISTHHQMQYPYNLPETDYTLIGWANNLSSFHWMNNEQNIESVEKEAEIVIYHKTKCLAIQTHPERMYIDSPIVNYLNDLLVLFVKDNQNKTQTI